jgi:uncharacterized protein (UPF0264 family)
MIATDTKTGLLISVRSADEVDSALSGGADLIDVKEPSHGPLGRAQDVVIRAVLNEVAGKLPVSAAAGELRDVAPIPFDWEALSFVKWGLSGCAALDWQSLLRKRVDRLGPRVVIVAYADAQLAGSPAPEDVLAFACSRPWPEPVLLIDTFDKCCRRNLLDWVSLKSVEEWCARCHAAGVGIALAGSLGIEEVERLLPLCPNWVGVRGAVCEGRDREGQLCAGKLDRLVRLLRSAPSLAG